MHPFKWLMRDLAAKDLPVRIKLWNGASLALGHSERVLLETPDPRALPCCGLRPHYGRTLWHWVDRLEAGRDEAIRMVGEKKFRIWEIYMAGSAHAFDTGWLSLFQILAARPDPDGRNQYPYRRDYMYC